MACTPMAVSAWRTSPSLEGLMFATTTFMGGPSVSSSYCHVPGCGLPQIWHLFGQMAQKSCKRERQHRDLCPPGPVQAAPWSVRMKSLTGIMLPRAASAFSTVILGETNGELVFCFERSAAGPLPRSAIPRHGGARPDLAADAGVVRGHVRLGEGRR